MRFSTLDLVATIAFLFILLAFATVSQLLRMIVTNADKDNTPDIQSLLQNLIKNGILPSGESSISVVSNIIPQLSLKEDDLKK